MEGIAKSNKDRSRVNFTRHPSCKAHSEAAARPAIRHLPCRQRNGKAP